MRKVRQKGMRLSRRRQIGKARITAALRTALLMRQTSLIPKPPPPPSSSTQLMSLIPCSLLFICNFLHCTLSYTHTKSESIFSVLWGLKVELCWPLVSPQLQALQGPSGGHGCLATSLCLHLSCEGPPLNPHLPFIILIIATPHSSSYHRHYLYRGVLIQEERRKRCAIISPVVVRKSESLQLAAGL